MKKFWSVLGYDMSSKAAKAARKAKQAKQEQAYNPIGNFIKDVTQVSSIKKMDIDEAMSILNFEKGEEKPTVDVITERY